MDPVAADAMFMFGRYHKYAAHIFVYIEIQVLEIQLNP